MGIGQPSALLTQKASFALQEQTCVGIHCMASKWIETFNFLLIH